MFESIAGTITSLIGLVRELLGFSSSVNEHDVELYQKYIALFGYGFLETWVDMRRYHYIDHEGTLPNQVYADFAAPDPVFANNNGKVIYRVRPRYNSEFLYNIDALNRIGAIALDYHTKEQWFSQPQP